MNNKYKDNIYLKDINFENIAKTEQEKVGVINLYSVIDSSNGTLFGETGWNGQQFKEAIEAYNDYNYDRIDVRICSPGGSIVDGYKMVSAILDSKIQIDTYNDGIAASMAGLILICGDNIYCKDFSLFMMHEAQSKSEDDDDQELKNIFNKTLEMIFVKRTDLYLNQIRDFMKNETWFDAEEQIKYGFCDSIIKTEKRKIKKKETAENLMNILNSYLQNDKINKNEDKINNKKSYINKQMKNELLNILNIDDESKISEKVKELLSQRDSLMENIANTATEMTKNEELLNTLKSEKESIEKEFEDLKNSIATAKKQERLNLIENTLTEFINTGKIKVEEKDKYSALLNTDFETVKNLLDNKTIIVKKESPKIEQILNNIVDNTDDRSNWTLVDWSKKDPEGLLKMKNETPELFNLLKK